jgi:hypothetical protein
VTSTKRLRVMTGTWMVRFGASSSAPSAISLCSASRTGVAEIPRLAPRPRIVSDWPGTSRPISSALRNVA